MLGLIEVITNNWDEIAITTFKGEYTYRRLSEDITRYIHLLKKLTLGKKECLGVRNEDKGEMLAFILACMYTDKRLIIIPDDISEINYRMLLSQTNCAMMFVGSSKDIISLPNTTPVTCWLDMTSLRLIHENELKLKKELIVNILSEIPTKKEIHNSMTFEIIRDLINPLIVDSTTEIGFVSPGIREGFKILIFTVGSLEEGLKETIHSLGTTKKTSLVYGEILPYTLIISILYPLFQGGKVVFVKDESRRALDIIEIEKINFFLVHSEIFRSIISHLMPDNKFLKKFRLWYRFRSYRETLKKVLLFGKIDTTTISNFNALGINYIYSYLLSEVASLVSFKHYKKLPLKKLTVGKPIVDLKIKTENDNKIGEINLFSPSSFSGYAYSERGNLRTSSNIFKGYFRTLDFGLFKNDELVVMGHYSELYRNEKGLTIQEGLIKAILLSYQYISDVVLTVHENKIFALIELDIAYLTTKRYSLDDICNTRIPKTLKELNGKLKEFTKVKDLIIFPSQLERVGGRVVTSEYNLSGLIKNLRSKSEE
jgi:hypothetical protein